MSDNSVLFSSDVSCRQSGGSPFQYGQLREETKGTWTTCLKQNANIVLLVATVLLLVVCIGLLGSAAFRTNTARLPSEKQQSFALSANDSRILGLIAQKLGIFAPPQQTPAGVRTTNISTICDQSQPKQFFSDIDYAMLGYNILSGYPLSDGHDPGFTLPLFRANYSQNHRTADCRYMVPKGLVVIPDRSCVTSFSSTIVKTEKELLESLSKSIGVKGGFLGFSFSLSATYKKTVSEISKGKKVYIISEAECIYYFSKLSKLNPPPFDPRFLQWIYRLNGTSEDDTFFEFFDTYGTHFSLDVTFGAKYIYQHKMKYFDYESMIQSGVDVEALANYAGLFSLGLDFKGDTRKTDAINFLSKVQTDTITVGAAPPLAGNLHNWASLVFNDPVPVRFTLSSIENLFTQKYMGFLNVSLQNLFSKVNSSKREYYQHLQDIGLIERHQESSDNIFLYMTNILGKSSSAAVVANRRECIEMCQKVNGFNCNAVLWAPNRDAPDQNCFLYQATQYTIESSNTIDTIIIRSNIHGPIVFPDTTLTGISTTYTGIKSSAYCGEYCNTDSGCVAYTYCDCSNLGICRLFTSDGIRGWKQDTTDTGSMTTFI